LKKIPLPVYVVIAVAAILWLPHLLTKGMFMDGIYNAIFAQNWAHGISSFWAPQTNDYSKPAYWNNPPLSMLTLGWCYRLFGDSIIVERIYSLACAIIQLILIAAAWKILWRNERSIREYYWVPCLLWLISPLTGWCYSNNLMENTMAIFTTLSFIAFLVYFQQQRYLLTTTGAVALCLLLAVLTKGPTGLFPLALPAIFLVAESSRWKGLLAYGLLQFILFIALFATVFSMAEARYFLQQYLALQLLPNVSNTAVRETSSYTILKELPIMIAPYLALGLAWYLLPKANRVIERKHFRLAVSFIIAGLAASLPVMLSMKQRKFYLLPSLPLFAIGFSILIMPLLRFIETRLPAFLIRMNGYLKAACLLIVAVCIGLAFYNHNRVVRDKVLLADIENVLPLLGADDKVCADWSLYGEWSLRAYCTRYYNKKIFMPDKISETRFYMTRPRMKGDQLPADAALVYQGSVFDLYKL
jgi:hypothetical protein